MYYAAKTKFSVIDKLDFTVPSGNALTNLPFGIIKMFGAALRQQIKDMNIPPEGKFLLGKSKQKIFTFIFFKN